MSIQTISYPTRYGQYNIRIEQDESPDTPRNWDNLGTMACWHRRYRLGDTHDYSDPDDFMEEIKTGKYIVMPLYLYDHSGITISTGPFGDKWDSMQVGFIYLSKEKACKEFGWKRLNQERLNKIKDLLIAEVNCYDQYLRGDVYGYTVVDKDGNDVDSCWGFYGDDWQESGLMDDAVSSIEYELSQKDKQVAEQIKRHLQKLRGWIRNGLPVIYRKPLQITIS